MPDTTVVRRELYYVVRGHPPFTNKAAAKEACKQASRESNGFVLDVFWEVEVVEGTPTGWRAILVGKWPLPGGTGGRKGPLQPLTRHQKFLVAALGLN